MYSFNDDNIKTLLKPIKKYLFKKSSEGDLILEKGIMDKNGKTIIDSTGPTFSGGAKQLNESRNFITNLESSKSGSFNGTADCTLGITGVLKPENGGTGVDSIEGLKNLLGGAPVASVNGQTGVVVLSAIDVGALPNTTKIPNALADLTDDTTHRTVTDTDKANWNAKSNFSGNYNDLTNKPTIPSISGLALKTDLDNYVKKSGDTMTGGLIVPDFIVNRKNNNYNALKVSLNGNATGFIQQDISNNRFKFIEISTDTEYGEGYQLPLPATHPKRHLSYRRCGF